jgi:hypothetical protein
MPTEPSTPACQGDQAAASASRLSLDAGGLRVRNDGPLRLQSPVAQKTPLGQDEPEAVRPAQPRPEGSPGLGLAHESPESRLQPRLQQDDAGVPYHRGVHGPRPRSQRL